MSDTADFFGKLLPPLVAALISTSVAVFSLWRNDEAANLRERRKEFRNEVENLVDLAKEIVDELNDCFWTESLPEARVKKSIHIVRAAFCEFDDCVERLLDEKRYNGNKKAIAATLKLKDAREQFYDFCTGDAFSKADSCDIEVNLLRARIASVKVSKAAYDLFSSEFEGRSGVFSGLFKSELE